MSRPFRSAVRELSVTIEHDARDRFGNAYAEPVCRVRLGTDHVDFVSTDALDALINVLKVRRKTLAAVAR
ncbi:MAG: hypothetical protein ABSD03_11005 [Vulcanimicrobiaceae bacterium]|jgi:hypothetical protein